MLGESRGNKEHLSEKTLQKKKTSSLEFLTELKGILNRVLRRKWVDQKQDGSWDKWSRLVREKRGIRKKKKTKPLGGPRRKWGGGGGGKLRCSRLTAKLKETKLREGSSRRGGKKGHFRFRNGLSRRTGKRTL